MREQVDLGRVAHGTHGTNCHGWLRLQCLCQERHRLARGTAGRVRQRRTRDAPDYGPRGCQKGLRHAKYMYGKQRVLYPMKRVGERGEGKWERIELGTGADEIADKFIDYLTRVRAESVTTGLGTQMVMKRASFDGLGRFATIAGTELPEAFAGVGDLPTGIYMTVGVPLLSDSWPRYFKVESCCLVWYCNSGRNAYSGCAFFLGSALQRHRGDRHLARVHAYRHARQQVGQPEARHRCSPGAQHGSGNSRGGTGRSRTTSSSSPICRSWSGRIRQLPA